VSSEYCVIIPVFNTEKVIADVLKSVLQYTENLIVVNDGSTDGTLDILCHSLESENPLKQSEIAGQARNDRPFTLVSYTKNHGKGYALQQGFSKAVEMGFTHAVTFDADGQHLACDIPVMVQKAKDNSKALIIGARKFDNPNIPQGSVFANKFSNFWFMVQTGKRLSDTQTGFRVYPLKEVGKMHLFTNRYEAELEILVRLAWRNIPIISQPVHVYYPPKEERISHFRGGKDFFRISVLNTVLCVLAVIYGYPSMFIKKIFISQ